MHTTKFPAIPGWTVIHNGDFSGNVTLVYEREGERSKLEIEVPFVLLKCVVATWARQHAMAQLVNATPNEVLRVREWPSDMVPELFR